MNASNETPVQRMCKEWGRNLRRAREAKRITQVELAKLVHLTQATVSAYELGSRPWTPEVMLAFALALEAKVTDLFAWPMFIEDMHRAWTISPAKAS